MKEENADVVVDTLGGRAHTRPGVSARDPLIFWRVARWRPSGVEDTVWKKRLDDHSKSVAAGIGLSPYAEAPRIKGILPASVDCPHRPREAGETATAHSLDDIVTYDFVWWVARVRLRLERHTEYWIETLTLDFSEPQPGAQSPVSEHFTKAVDHIVRIKALLSGPAHDRRDADRLREDFEPISTHLFSTLLTFAREQKVMCADARAYGEVFADLRGLVLGEGDRGASDPVDPLGKGRIHVRPAFWRDADAKRQGDLAPVDLSVADWEAKARQLWPFVSAPIGDDTSLTDFEYSASIMLGGRALHVSALGAAHPARGDLPVRPVYSWFLVNGLGGWATARLVEALCQQGVLRFAAIHNYEHLRKAARHLHEAETQLIEAATGRRAEDLSEKLRSIQGKVGEADALLAGGGVGYRVQRAGYYIAQFFAGLPRLNIKPVGEFQAYDAFVRARMGEAFTFIEVLGARYDRVRREERLLIEQIRNTRVAEGQGLADGALLLALFPYYLGMIVSHALWPSEHHGAPGAFWFMCLFAGVAGATFRQEPGLPPRGRLHPARIRTRVFGHILVLSIAYASMFFAAALSIVVAAGLLSDQWRGWLDVTAPTRQAALRLVVFSGMPVILVIASRWPGQRWRALDIDLQALRSRTSGKAPTPKEAPNHRRWLSPRRVMLVGALAVLAYMLQGAPVGSAIFSKPSVEEERKLDISVSIEAPGRAANILEAAGTAKRSRH